jgi:histone deacetylase 1/2
VRISARSLESSGYRFWGVTEGDIYPFFGTKTPPSTGCYITTGDLWPWRLGHPGSSTLSHFPLDFLQTCNKTPASRSSTCEACQLGRQPRLPFPTSSSLRTTAFDLIHCDLWTSPVVSFSGYKYYLVILDDFSHYSWTFPLRYKSDTCDTLQHFFHFVATQFHVTIKCMQSDNGGEFISLALRQFFSDRGVVFRLSCPHTSPQNGKAERLIRTTNDIVRTLLL